MAKCWECGKKFCYDDIWVGQFKNDTKRTDEARNICDGCKKEHGY